MYYVFVLKAQNEARGVKFMAISIKAARVNAGLTQTQVGDSVGKTKNTIANYEAYISTPDVKTAQAMASLFNMSVDDIIWTKE